MGFISKIKRFKSAIRFGGYNEIKISKIDYAHCLDGKNILITGASGGIGYEIAKKCCSCGASVIITGRNEEKLKKAKETIGTSIDYLQWDITDIDSLKNKLEIVLLMFDGKIDCLVNNAGLQPHEFFPNVSEKEWNVIYDTNSKGLFFLTQELCRHWSGQKANIYTRGHTVIHAPCGADGLRPLKYRKVINIDSQGGFVGAAYPYRMVKWDIRGLTRGLGLKLAKDGVLVNAIAPGIVKTGMQPFSLEQGNNTYCAQNPLNRICLPEEVAEMAVFMISDACNFLVGQTILMDGGYSLK